MGRRALLKAPQANARPLPQLRRRLFGRQCSLPRAQASVPPNLPALSPAVRTPRRSSPLLSAAPGCEPNPFFLPAECPPTRAHSSAKRRPGWATLPCQQRPSPRSKLRSQKGTGGSRHAKEQLTPRQREGHPGLDSPPLPSTTRGARAAWKSVSPSGSGDEQQSRFAQRPGAVLVGGNHNPTSASTDPAILAAAPRRVGGSQRTDTQRYLVTSSRRCPSALRPSALRKPRPPRPPDGPAAEAAFLELPGGAATDGKPQRAPAAREQGAPLGPAAFPGRALRGSETAVPQDHGLAAAGCRAPGSFCS